MNEFYVILNNIIFFGAFLSISVISFIKYIIQPCILNNSKPGIIIIRTRPFSLFLISLLYAITSIKFYFSVIDINLDIINVFMNLETIATIILGIFILNSIHDKGLHILIIKILLYSMGFSIFLGLSYFIYGIDIILDMSYIFNKIIELFLISCYFYVDIRYKTPLTKYRTITALIVILNLSSYILSIPEMNYITSILFASLLITISEISMGKLIVKRSGK